MEMLEMLKLKKKSVSIDETVQIEDAEQCETQSVEIIRKSAILRNKDVYAYYRNIFDKCDTDKDGFINTSELRQFIANNEEDEIPEEVIKKLHLRFDQDKDDKLDFCEFLDMINHPTVARTFTRVGSRYLKFVTISSVRRTSLKLRRTLTNTGLYEEEIILKKYAIGMILLSVVQIVCFYIDLYIQKECGKKPITAALRFKPESRNQIWRYVTHILVHVSAIHLYGNVFIQLLIGVPLELVHCWRVPVVYVVGAFGGCLAHSVVNNGWGLVGGSGGLYAFYTANIATVIMNWREMSHPIVHLLFFGIITIFDAIYNYCLVFNKQPSRDEPSYIAHLGGAVVGLLLGVNILRNLRETKTEKIVWFISIISLVILFTIFITLNITVYVSQNK